MARTKDKKFGKLITKKDFFKAKQEFWMATGECFVKYQLHCPATKDLNDKQNKKFIDYIIASDHYWEAAVILFMDSGFEKYTQTMFFSSFGKLINMKDRINKETKSLIDKQNKNHVISFGFFATPSDTLDLEQMQDDVINFFDKGGAFDRAHCDRVKTIIGIKDAI